MKTSLQMIERTLGILGVLGTGQSVQAEDEAVIRSYMTAAIDALDKRGIVSLWASYEADEFEDEHFLTLPRIIAGYAAPQYGMNAEMAALRADGEEAIQEILSTKTETRGEQPSAPLYF